MSASADSALREYLVAGADGNTNLRARAAAYAGIDAPVAQVPSVTYLSAGQVLVIANRATLAAAAPLQAHAGLHCVVLLGDSDQLPGTVSELHGMHAVHGKIQGLSGHLGAFVAETDEAALQQALKLALPADTDAFDLVLDFSDTPLIGSAVSPPGYYAVPGGDTESLREALQEIPTLVGEFEKPRYFLYDASICAHGRSGIEGCNRCIETCPTDAITGNGDVIQVNPNLCQGAGSCATACPTGAITYGFPPVAATLQYWRSLLKRYRESGGEAPLLLVYDAESGGEAMARMASQLPDNVLPVEVEELGSVGLDAWLAALAWGAAAVRLLVTPAVAPSVFREVKFQVSVARALLVGLGYAGDKTALMTEAETGALAGVTTSIASADFAALDEKRTLLRLALDHLVSQAGQVPVAVELPQGAPFGHIEVNAGSCTLCMACVSQCPANALAAGDDSPQIRFVEAKCVQCGICARSCPENAISLRPRFLTQAGQRDHLRILHEDEPFCCIRCRKPFATHSVIARITEKMKDHPMFSGDALERLKMCEDCRVKDMYSQEALHE